MPQRVDLALVDRGICDSREKARRAVLAGKVRINDRLARKASDPVQTQDRIAIDQPEPYVSRGGIKLEHALREFHLDVSGLVALDVGASTGGFTDCLLQHGAARVFAVDVGQGQLAWKLRQDPRVVVMEQTNARFLAPASFPAPFQPFGLITADCSFISLRRILPAVWPLLHTAGRCVALVKPQFEAGKEEADRGAGVIRDPAVHRRVLEELQQFTATLPRARWTAHTPSPITGPAGNLEFLALIESIP